MSRSPVYVRLKFVENVLRFCAARGIDSADLARRAGLAAEQLPGTSAAGAVPWTALVELSRLAEKELADPFLGIRLAQENKRGSFGVIEYLARNAPDLGHAFDTFARYQRIISDSIFWSRRVQDGDAVFEFTAMRGVPVEEARHFGETSIASVVRYFRELVDPSFAPRAVWFMHARPSDIGELVSFFGTKDISFGRPTNGFSCEPAFVERPIASADPDLLPLLNDHARLLLASTPDVQDFLGVVKQRVRAELSQGAPTMESIAEKLHMGSRTLQRRLAEHETTFQDLVDDVRQKLSFDLLADKQRALTEIAFLLGYTSERAFLRAFKRWTGSTPAAYRSEGTLDRR
jgi:AraC-like DNA-binding protein